MISPVSPKVVRTAPQPVTTPASAVVIPNNDRDRNASNGVVPETGRTFPGAVVAVPADG